MVAGKGVGEMDAEGAERGREGVVNILRVAVHRCDFVAVGVVDGGDD